MTHEGATITSLTMRRPLARDSRDAQRGGGSAADAEMRLFANLCEVAPGVLEDGPGRLPQAAEAVRGFFGRLTVSAVGRSARCLPAPADLRRVVGVVAHTFATPIPAVWEMELAEVLEWA